ncbi:hypothetical protein [Pedobacter gandavensis]|nr:hypothetical protein [Pedobacter gandavensis]
MRKAIYFSISLILGFASQVLAQQGPIFPKGEKSPNVHHVGNVWLSNLIL